MQSNIIALDLKNFDKFENIDKKVDEFDEYEDKYVSDV